MRKLIAFVALVASVGCTLSTDSTTTGPLVGDISGTYSLRTMNGSPIPITIVGHDTTVIIDTDVLVLTPVGDWSETVGYRQTVGAAATTNESFALSGGWIRSGNSLRFSTANGLFYIGTATDTSLNLTDAANSYVFKH
jgi:hypothetical protein